MKRIVITLLFIQFAAAAQNSREIFAAQNAHRLTRQKLLEAKFVNEIVPGQPAHWDQIINLVSVNVSGLIEGGKVSAESHDATLTDAQKTIFNFSDPGAMISIDIRFRWKDELSAAGEYGKVKEMNDINLVVTPDKEAEFAGGPDKINAYLEDNFYKKIEKLSDKYFPSAEGYFTIDDKGHVSDAHFNQPFPEPEIEKILLTALSQMPDWKPATNNNGDSVKQVFSFRLNIPNQREIAGRSKNKKGC
jgi:hypothetical protein